MADLSLTAVTATAKTTVHSGTAGEALTAGEAVYLDSNDNRLYKAIATGKASARCVGLMANAAAEGAPCDYVTGVVDIAGATAGLVYFVSGATAGDVSPHTDATTPATGEYTTAVFVARTATRAYVYPIATDGTAA